MDRKFLKGKVYKIILKSRVEQYPRDYLIFSPESDNDISGKSYTAIKTLFTVALDGSILTKFDSRPSEIGIEIEDNVEQLNKKQDFIDINNVMRKLGHDYKYNRKLEKIIDNSN